jgi:hypothetical protein
MSFEIDGAVRGWMILPTPTDPPAWIGFLVMEDLAVVV